MESFQELFTIAERLEAVAATSDAEGVSVPLESLDQAAYKVASSFSGSCLGYHSRVYYRNFAIPPAGANFSAEWGLQDVSFSGLGSRGDWQEYQFDYVTRHIQQIAGNPNLDLARSISSKANKEFDAAKSEIESTLEMESTTKTDTYLQKLKKELDALAVASKVDVVDKLLPGGTMMTRDALAMSQGTLVPPHIDVIAEVMAIRHSFGVCRATATIAKKAASHMERKNKSKRATDRIGTNVFIGHGRSLLWRELKDFVQDRANLPWDEFNRVPIAGVTNIARLSEMLDAAAIAFLVMTAEDEMADGNTQARMNVVHEAGLFQGRLGFTRAIVLLEEGCTEFSNINGLGQIRFPKGNIRAAFEEIRQVLEREGLIVGIA